MTPQDLATLESLSEKLYASPNDLDRQQATRALQAFLNPTKLEILPQMQYILDNTNSAFALFLACNTLAKLATEKWSLLNTQAKLDMRNYLLTFLGKRGAAVPDFVLKAIIKLVCLVIKLIWLDNPEHSQEIMKQLSQFLQASVVHCLIGLRIFTQLVEEMNNPKSGGLQINLHRRVANSFRDNCLLQIFTVSLATLQRLLSKSVGINDATQEDRLTEQALKLALGALSFDFIGTAPDESAADFGTVQAPAAWRTVMQDPATLKLFADIYASSTSHASIAMGCLVQMASVRRTLFNSEEERQQFLANLMRVITDILRHKRGLSNQDNHHEFCRLLARLKGNYQLSQIVEVDGYAEWITLVAEFTCSTFSAWQWAANSTYYLLSMWSRLISSMHYLKSDRDVAGLLNNVIPRVIETYVTARLESVQILHGKPEEDDPLRDSEQLHEHLESLPFLGRCNYPKNSAFIVSRFDPLAQAFQQMPPTSSSTGSVIEGQLSWLVYLMGALVGGRSTTNCSDEYDEIDAELSARAFKLMQIHDQRLQQSAGQADERLEWALLFFIGQFRRMYIGEQSLPSSKLYKSLSHLMGLNDHVMVMNLVITKICRNLKTWATNESVVSRSLQLFNDLASGYSSGKLLAKMDLTGEILDHHTSQYFPFLDYPMNACNRTIFYGTLARVLFMEPHVTRFNAFMQPFKQSCNALVSRAGMHPDALRQADSKQCLLFLLRDLLGIVTAINSHRSYLLFFDWIYPDHMPLLVKAGEVFYDEPSITAPLLKFMSDLVYNKSGRITFAPSSPNGILLFREASKLLVAYGQRLVRHTPSDPEDPYSDKYKGVWLCMQILTRALTGNYVNFGVFALYGDPALSNALQVVLQLSLAIPFKDLIAYPKVMRSFYLLINVLFHNHPGTMLELDTPILVQIISATREGLTSLSNHTAIATQCCDTLDHMLVFLVENKTKDSPPMRSFANHVGQHPEMLPGLLEMMMQVLLFDENMNLWSLARPLLCLILLIPGHLGKMKEQFQQGQVNITGGGATGDLMGRQQRMEEAFTKLMGDIKDNILPKNRDKFAQNLTLFKTEIKPLLL